MSSIAISGDPALGAEPRNVVLCFDGTGDWVGFDETNVAQIFSKLVKDETQLTFYDGGVGTLTNPQALTGPQRVALRLIDLGVATGLREKVLNGYNFLVRNYREGDRIFLFGFSRGAYTARLVASMVHNFGLVQPEHEVLSQYLWQTLESIPPGRDVDDAQSPIGVFKRTANRLKRDFSRRTIKIHFMGLFDTVSSVGILRRFNVYPNTDKNPSVLRVCHGVAIDEQRNAFPEALFHPQQPGLTEVWFPGVHRDVGGGLPEGQRRIANEALAWIAKEAVANGLHLTSTFTPVPNDDPAPNYPGYDPYVFLGFYPMKMFVKRVTGFRFIWPNFRHLRTIPEDALVHEIAFTLKDKGNYAPVNFPLQPRIFPQQANVAGSLRYLLRPRTLSPADLVGTLFGTTLVFLLWNRCIGAPLGETWPSFGISWKWLASLTTGHIAFLLFAAFLGSQILGQKFSDTLPKDKRPRAEGFLPVAGAVVVVLVAIAGWKLHWEALGWSALAGLVVALASQLPGDATLPTDRTLPSVLWAAVGTGVLFGVVQGFGWPVTGFQLALFALSVTVIAALCDVFLDRGNQRNNDGDKAPAIGEVQP